MNNIIIKKVIDIEDELNRIENEINKKEKEIKKNIEIDVIFHLGDIHIPGNPDRENEYEKVLKMAIKTISNDKRRKMVIICGDLFHDKTKPYQEANILARDFMQGLGDVCETIIIQGNHDINIDNENRKDSIKSALQQLKTTYPIHYLTENKIYKINGINFGLTKMTNNKPTPIGIRNLFELYIGLYHGTLYKSKTDEGYEFNDITKIKGSDFKEYDIVMLGDIHKFQYLNKEKTIAYSGSLVQQNFGESIKNHGILVWDLKTKKSELIEIPNEYIYKTHLITDINNYEIPDIENKLCRLKIMYKGVERLDLIKYEKEIKMKYNIIQYMKQEITEEIVINKETKEEIMNKKFMDIYKDFLIKNKLTENIKVTEMLEKIIDEEQVKVTKDKKEIRLFELEFENLLAYGSNNKINFNKLSGINILAGTNGLGKSSLIDIILFTIYNKCSKGEGKDILNIRYDKGYSILRLELNGEKYTIYRNINKGKTNVCLLKNYSNKVEINNELKNIEFKKKNKLNQKNNEINNEINISEDGKYSIDRQIKNLFGEYEDMIMTSVILQNGENFIDLKYDEQKKILTNILGLNIFENVRIISSQKYRNYTSIILKNIEKQITTIDYNNLIFKEKEELQKNEEDLKNKNIKYNDLLKEQHIIEYNIDKSIINKDNNYSNILDIEIGNKAKNLQEIEKRIDKINNEFRYELENDKDGVNNKIENDIIKNQNKIIELSKQLKEVNTNENYKIEDKDKIETKIKEINKEIIEINKEQHTIKEENLNIMSELMIKKEGILKNKEEYEKEREIIIKEKYKKELLLESIKIQKENNKDLLNHKFDDKCEYCINNKKIHCKIGYLEKIIKLENEIEQINYNENDIIEIDKKIYLIKKYLENENKNNINNLKLEKLGQEIKIYNNDIKIITENLKIKKANNLVNIKIVEYEKEVENCYKIKKNVKEYDDLLIKINKLKEEIEELKSKKNIYYLQIENIKKVEYIKKEKEILEKEKNEINSKIKNLIIIISKYGDDKIKQEKIQNEYKIHQEIAKTYKEILNLFDNGFMDYVMMKRLNILEKKMNNIISALAGYEIKIKIESKNIKFYKLSKEEKDINLKSLCGYERIIFNISLRLALNNMNVMIKNNFIIIDESFSGADSTNIHKFSLVIETIKKEYDICILISHIEEIKNQRGNIMKIEYNKNTFDSKINIT